MKRTLAMAGAVTVAAAAIAALRMSGGGTLTSVHAAFTPPTSGMYFAIDCDLAAAGIQDECTLPEGTATWDVGIVLGNVDVAGVSIGALFFDVVGDNQPVFTPRATTGSSVNRNPDFADFPTGTWTCQPLRDTDPSEVLTRSRLSCWGSSGMPFAPPGELLLATLRLDVHGGGLATFDLESAAVGTELGIELASCNPVNVVESPCSSATVTSLGAAATATGTPTNTPSPTPTQTLFPGQPTPTHTPTAAPTIAPPPNGSFIALDCAPALPGIQHECVLAPGAVAATLDVVFGNVDFDGEDVSSFYLSILGSNQVVFHPPPGLDFDLDANPDFRDPIAPEIGEWHCTPPAPNPDADPSPYSSDSFLSCFVVDIGNPIPAGTTQVLARLHLTVLGSGSGSFSLANAAVGNFIGVELGSCNPVSITEAACFGATLVSVPCSDLDCDNIPDLEDNCVSTSNGTQANTDRNEIWLQPARAFDDITRANSDGLGDACDDDDDNDGISDLDEATGAACGGVVTSPILADTDGDRMLDGAECSLGTDPLVPNTPPGFCNTSADADGDTIIAGREICYYGTSDSNINSDGDMCSDRREIMSINADSTVNAIDLAQVAQAFGPYPIGSPAYLYNFDVTKDGSISAIDLMQVAQAFGACP